jgi:serine/threonine-protein kinase HipA
MRRNERRRAKDAGSLPRTLTEADFLLLVNDETRLGSLRFCVEEGGPFLAPNEAASRIPLLIDLPKLLSASARLEEESDDAEDLRLLLAPGSSLGGARPKAGIRDFDGRLAIAKFPSREDEIDVVRWEEVALSLAYRAGIRVPLHRVEIVLGKPVLVVRRFDREGSADHRIPFLSAMSMLDARDGERRSYPEIMDALRRYGAFPERDGRELWRRMLFSVFINNVDDHLRNHGFLHYGSEGWILSPAYDLNPVPLDIKARVLSTAIVADESAADPELAFSTCGYYGLSLKEAKSISQELAQALRSWRALAQDAGIPKSQVERMSSAFSKRNAT